MRTIAITFLLLMLWGCTDYYGPAARGRPGMLQKWEAHLAETVAPTPTTRRVPAEQSAPRCLKDRLSGPSSDAFLRTDLARMEAEYNGPAVKTIVKGIDLSRFPKLQAKYIEKNQNIITSDVTYSDCPDVYCVINRAYGLEGEMGVRIYWNWLKSGYATTLIGDIPDLDEGTELKAPENAPQPSRTDFFFSNEELTHVGLTYSMLNSAFFANKNLTALHRVPRGYRLKGSENTCGLARSIGTSSGNILLFDNCLEKPKFEDLALAEGPKIVGRDRTIYKLEGKLQQMFTHELGHHVDYINSGTERRGNYLYRKPLSESQEWLDFSGWSKDEWWDPAKQTWFWDWKNDPAKEGFVRDYAGTDPGEDFAETLAYARFVPETAEKVAPLKSKFLTDKYFDKRTFTLDGLKKFFVDSVSVATKAQVLELVQGCLADPGSEVDAMPATPRLQIEVPVPAAVVECLDRGLHRRLGEQMDKLRGTELQACDYLDDHEPEFRTEIVAAVNADVSATLEQQAAVAERLAQVKRLREELSGRVDVREAFLDCYIQESPQSCYEQVLEAAFQAAVAEAIPQEERDGALSLDDLLLKERALYFSENSFGQARSQTILAFNSFFAGIDGKLNESATRRWESCVQAGEGHVDPIDGQVLVRPFTGGTHFVPPQILNCINVDARADVDSVRSRFLGKFGLAVTDPDADAFLNDVFMPQYLAQLQAHLEAAVRAEKTQLSGNQDRFIALVRADIIADLSWLERVTEPSAAERACAPVSTAAFDRIAGSPEGQSLLALRFLNPSNLRGTWEAAACGGVLKDPRIPAILKTNADLIFRERLPELDPIILGLAREKAKTCWKSYPSTTSTTQKSSRAKCLTYSWKSFETQTVDSWLRTPTGQMYRARKTEAAGYLRDQRSRLQEIAISEMESPK